ncbi:MAG: VCBS domain-containing protein [Pararhodobacter sp.]
MDLTPYWGSARVLTVRDTVSRTDDFDGATGHYYLFFAPFDGTLTISMSDMRSGGGLATLLFSPDGEPVPGMVSSSTDGVSRWRVSTSEITAESEYLIRVWQPQNYDSPWGDRYSLSLGFEPADPSFVIPPAPEAEYFLPFPDSLISLKSDLGWDVADALITSVEGAVVHIGHEAGDRYLLELHDGTVSVRSDGITMDGTLLAGGTGERLFTGQMTFDTQSLAASSFQADSNHFGLVNGLVGVDFSQLTLRETEVALAADLIFPRLFEDFNTTGAPLSLQFGETGMRFGPGLLGTADWIPDVAFSLGGNAGLDLAFTDIGIDYDGLNNDLYFSGRAVASLTGALASQLDTLQVSRLALDLAGTREGPELYQRGDRFIRFSLDDDGALDWDIVGSLTYTSTTGLIRELGFQIDTPAQSFAGTVEAALPFLGAGVVANGTVTGSWEPLVIDSLHFGLEGVSYPLGATGLFLNGGSIGIEGLAARPDDPGLGREFSAEVLYTFGTSSGGLPTPLRGAITGIFSEQSVSAGFTLTSRLGWLFGDSAVAGAQAFMSRFLGIDGEAFFNFELASLSGRIEADLGRAALSASLEGQLLGSVYSGEARLDVFQAGTGRSAHLATTLNAKGAINLPLIGSVSGNVRMVYSDDGDMSNDYIAAWTTFSVFQREFAKGFKLGFDGEFRNLSGAEIELIGSWLLDPSQQVVVLSAQWETPSEGARLVVIRPDGTRLTEADLAADPDIEIVEALSSSTSRHVAIRHPESGIWDIELVGGPSGETVSYNASDMMPALAVRLEVLQVDGVNRTAELDLVVTGGIDEWPRVAFFASTEPDVASGQQIQVSTTFSSGSPQESQRGLRWDFGDLEPGTYFLHAVAEAGGQLPQTGSVATPIVIPDPDDTAGGNQPARIAGTLSGLVVEDDESRQRAEGQLSVSDPDPGENRFAAPEPGALQGHYGRFAFDAATGAWSYTLDNDSDAVQSLPGGTEVFERLSVSSIDGTARETITVTVQGTNDHARIEGDSGALIIQDGTGNLDASGVLTVIDPDAGEDRFQTISNLNFLRRTHGRFDFDAETGVWAFTLDDDAPTIDRRDTVTETLPVRSIDGTASETITVTIAGTSIAPSAGNSAEDAPPVVIGGAARGEISATDNPQDWFRFTAMQDKVVSATLEDLTDDLDLWVFDAEGVLVAWSDYPSRWNEATSFAVQAGMTYDLLVDGFQGASSGYWLDVVPGVADRNSLSDHYRIGQTLGVDASEETGAFLQRLRFKPEETGTVSFQITGDEVPISLSLLTRTSSGESSSRQLVRNDDAAVIDGSFQVQAGTEYSLSFLGDRTDFSFRTWTGLEDPQAPQTEPEPDPAPHPEPPPEPEAEPEPEAPPGNTPALIAGDATGRVVEDDPDRSHASGTLTITDPDPGEDRFREPEPDALAGDFGTFTFDPETGVWSYKLDNDAEAVQALPEGAEITDSLTVTSLDGTASEMITVTIRGTAAPDSETPVPDPVEPAPLPPHGLQGLVTTPGGRALEGVRVTFSPDDGASLDTETGANGSFGFAGAAGLSGHLGASRAYDPDADGRLSAADALDVLRLAVGVAPSFGPAAPEAMIAADINGDGQITAADALDVLRVAVGLEGAHAPRWVFIDADADLSQVDRGTVAYDIGIAVNGLDQDTEVGMKGILLGSMQEFA